MDPNDKDTVGASTQSGADADTLKNSAHLPGDGKVTVGSATQAPPSNNSPDRSDGGTGIVTDSDKDPRTGEEVYAKGNAPRVSEHSRETSAEILQNGSQTGAGMAPRTRQPD